VNIYLIKTLLDLKKKRKNFSSYTRPAITFVVNFLARYNSSLTKRHWTRVKHIFHYLKATMNMGLFYPNDSKSYLMSYANAGYLSVPHNGQS